MRRLREGAGSVTCGGPLYSGMVPPDHCKLARLSAAGIGRSSVAWRTARRLLGHVTAKRQLVILPAGRCLLSRPHAPGHRSAFFLITDKALHKGASRLRWCSRPISAAALDISSGASATKIERTKRPGQTIAQPAATKYVRYCIYTSWATERKFPSQRGRLRRVDCVN